ncbi:type I secretion C-terminal target domain-containing protein [Limnohabitans sp. T6-20]|uniref:type I secretion C-terminal target domain-containing protein n=1 Tax=Limnohabitans sp. T6-20 TaxID=1100725 RepID=UPI000D343CD2|nr:type I secretion C-terminal target domain-containing protein [Limnohabitans sp. T6-20]PUE07619.1 hypothetical protein B9Z33_11590 [Limnohabitans sp. T6-20]
MATVHLSVPHLTRTLQRGERVVLQDVLRVERAGDDLLAWVRQVDGSIQLQRLQNFYLPDQDALLVLESTQIGEAPQYLTAQTALPSTVLEAIAPDAVATLAVENDIFWVQSLASDLAHVDAAFLHDGAASGLSQSSVLSGVYRTLESADVKAWEPLTESGAQTIDKQTLLPGPVDTVPPVAPTIDSPVAMADGFINRSEALAGVLLQGTAEAGSTVMLRWSQGSGSMMVTADAQGRWHYLASYADLLNAKVTSGKTFLLAKSVDAFGLVSIDTGRELEIRLSQPNPPTAELDDPTPTRWSATATSYVTPAFWGVGPANGKVVWYLDRNGDGLAEASEWLAEASTDSAGHYNLTLPSLAAGQTHALLAVAVDRFGNASATSTPIALAVDTSPPALPTLDSVTGDNAISLAEQQAGVVFSGTGEAGAKVLVQRKQGGETLEDEVVVGPQGLWTLTIAADNWGQIASGSVDVKVRQVDPAGNESGWTSALPVTVTLVPAVPSALAISSDTGADATDGLTATTQQVISGRAVAGSTVTVFDDRDNDGVLDLGESLQVVTADATTGVFQTTSLNFAQGEYQLRAFANVGGQLSDASQVKRMKVDTQAPTISMTQAADVATGTGLINVAKQASGTRFEGAAENGLLVSLSFKDSNNQTLTHNGQALVYTTTATAGSWAIVLTSAQLATLAAAGQGAFTAEVSQTDGAGNTGTATRSVTVDTIAPAGVRSQQATALSLQSAGELSGGVDWSDVVDDGQVLVPVALPDNLGTGGSLRLNWGGQFVTHTITNAEVAQGYAQVAVSVDVLLAAGAGSKAVSVVFTDAASNASVAMPVTADALGTSVVAVDFSSRPPVIQLAQDSYHRQVAGTYHSNEVQGVTVWVSGVAGSNVTLSEGSNSLGSVQLDAYGLGSTVLQLTPGLHTLSAQASGTLASSLRIMMDNVRPATPTVTALADYLNDDLVNARERDGQVQIRGTCASGHEVSYWLYNTLTGVVSDTVTVTASGTNWTGYISLEQWFQVGDGTLQLNVRQIDFAGNVSDTVETGLTLDSLALAPVVDPVAGDDRINGLEQGQVVLRGAAEPGATVSLLLQGPLGTVSKTLSANATTGAWTQGLTSAEWAQLGEGSIRLTATQTDRAGNVSTSTVRNLTLDTAARDLSVNAFAGDNRINLAETQLDQTLTGLGEAGATITIELGGLAARTATVSSNGRWSTSFTAAEMQGLSGSPALTVTETDLAGNTATQNRTLSVNTVPLSAQPSLTSPVSVLWSAQAQPLTLTGSGPTNTRVYLHLVGSRGAVDLGPAEVVNGHWSLTLASAQMRTVLGAGDVSVQLWASSADGAQSSQVVPGSFVLQSEVPSPSLLVVAEDDTINLAEKQAGVVIEGTGVAGHTVALTLTRGSASRHLQTQVAANGTWRVSLTDADYAALGEGVVSLAVKQVFNGLESLTVSSTLTVDTTPPAAPTSAAQTAAAAANAASELAGGVTALEAVDGVPVVLPLPANAAVGDRIEIFWGSSTEAVLTYVVRASDLQANAQTLTLTVPGEEIALLGSAANLSVTYRVTDAAGNADVLRTAVSGLNVSAPPQAPQFNAVMTDGYVNQQEYNQAPITLTGQVSGSGTLSLRLTGSNSQVLNLTPTVTAGSWSLTLSAAQLDSLGEGTIGMQATQVVSGVTSPTATGSFVFDKTLPASVTAARIQAALERNVDTELSGGLLATVSNNNLTEAYDGTVLYVPLAADAVAGDSLRVFWGSQQGSGGVQVDVSLTLTDVQRGYAAVTISEGVITQVGDNANLRVEALTVDRAGNAGARYEAWTGPVDAVPAMPTLQAVTPDNILNITEMAGTLTVSGFADAGRSVQVRLVKGFDTIAQTVTADVVSGAWSWTLSAAQKSQLAAWGQGPLEAQARQVDGTGNPSQWQVATVTVDTVAPTPPVVNVVAGDDRISRSEALSASGVRLTGTGEAGASVVLTFKNGSTTLLAKGGITVNSSGEWEAVLNAADFASFPSNTGSAGVNLSVSAVQTDAAGNPSVAASKGFVYSDDVVNAPAGLTVQDVADQYFNAADGSTGLQISGTGDAGRWVRVRVTVGDVVTDLPVVQVAPDGSWRATVTGAALTALGQGAATVQAVQRNGSGIHADESSAVTYGTAFVIDTVVPALQSAVLVVEDSAGQPRAHAKVGDVLLIKIRLSEDVTLTAGTSDPAIDLGAGLSGDAVYDATRSAALGSQWLVFKYVVQANDSALEGVIGASGFTVIWNGVVLQDVAGNPLAMSSIAPQIHGIRVDTLAPAAPSVVGLVAADANSLAADLAGSAGGDKINVAELNTGKALVKVSLGSGVLANDQLEVQFSWTAGGAQTYTSQTTLLASDVANGFAVLSLPVQALSGLQGVTDLSAQARVVDVAGNASGWSAPTGSWDLDTLAPAAPSIPAVATDNRMSASERAALSDITLTGLEAGASVEAWIEGLDSTQTLVTRTLTLSNGTVSAAALNTALTGLADGTWTLKTRQTDTAGNVSETATRAVAMDTDVPGNPVMTVAAASDAWVNVAETSAGLSVTVDLRNTRTKVGDTLAFSWGSHSYSHVLSAGQPDTLLTLVLPASFVSQSSTGPATGEAFDLSVKIVDTGGNESASSSLSGKTLDTLIAAPVISAASLDTVTALEAKSAGTFAGSGAEAGATVVVVLNSSTTGQVRRMSTLAGNDGTYSFALTPSDYKDLGGTNASSTINVSVTQTDRAGNTSTASTGAFALNLSLSPPTFFDLTGDNLISATESATSQTLKGTGSPGATVSLNFYDASAGSGAAALLSFSNVTVNASGQWTQSLSAAHLTTLAGGATSSRNIRVEASQAQGADASSLASLVFAVDKSTPVIDAVARFDGNSDGANNDGLVVRFTEPVQSSGLKNVTAWLLNNSHSFGKGARVEAMGELTLNGTSYAQEFRIYWGTSPTVATSDTVTVNAAWVIDAVGNAAATAQVFTVPSLVVPAAATPPVTIAADNRINATEYAAATSVAMTHVAAVAGSQMRVYLDGVLIRTVSMATNATSTNLSLTSADWGSATGQKSLTTQIVQTDGSTSAFSAPKPVTLDTLVEPYVRAEVLTDTGAMGVFNTGDVVTLHFKEAVALVAGSLPGAFGASATVVAVDPVKQVGDASVYATAWQVTLGTSPTLTAGQSYALSGIKDLAGNTANLSVGVRADVFSQATPSLVIDNVATNNVVDAAEKSSPLQILVQLTAAKVGDVIHLSLDGTRVGSVTVAANGQSTATFSLDAALLGGDGERVLAATLDRSGATAASSLNRSVYVAADRAHWSAVYADTVWFDPDTLMTLKDGAQVTSWTTSTATRNVLGNLVNLVPRAGTVPKITDASGHVSLYFNGASSLYSTSQIANPRVDLTGMSDFSMLKLLGYPTAWGYTMSRELDGVNNGTVYAFRHHFGGLQTTLSSHYAGWGSNTIANAATVSSWLVMNGYNDASAQSLAVNNRILSTTANSLMFANSGKGGLGGVGTLAVGGSGWTGSGSAEFVTGVMGDQIAFNYGLSAAMRGEVATYLAAKYQSEGRKVASTAVGASYDLSLSANANPTIDELLQLNTTALGAGHDTIKTAGADYVNAGSGNDLIAVTDLAFRFIDGGLGRDTLQLDAAYQGRSAIVLADFVSNVRGISGVTAADERVNAAGYHGLAGLEVLDLRQTEAAAGSVVAQVLTVAAADVAQMSETNRLEVLLGDRDVLLTSGFSATGYGHFLVEGQSYSARYSATSNNESVELYVRGGRLAPDLEGMSLSGAALQLDFNTALTGAAPLLGDFSINTWGGAAGGLSSVTSLNNRQSLYMAFSSAVASPVQVVYSGSMKDEFGRSLGHNIWGIGTEGTDTLDASSWSGASGAAIVAGSGNDTVIGTSGADLIVGGLGADTLTGGLGSDRFAYNTVTQGSGGTGGLGGTGGDVITDFNTSSNSPNADVLDLSDLFQLATGDKLTGDAQHDAQTLMAGGYIDLVRVNSGKDLQVWVDRDGGDVMGQLVTLKDIGAGLGTYFTVSNETSEQLLQRLLTEGRMQVTHA